MEFMQHNVVYVHKFMLNKVKTDFLSARSPINQIGTLICWIRNLIKQIFYTFSHTHTRPATKGG